MNVAFKRKPMAKNTRLRAAALVIGLSLLTVSAMVQACTGFSNTPRHREYTHDTYPEQRGRWFRGSNGPTTFNNCTADFDLNLRLDAPGLTYVGTLDYLGMTFPAYEFGPESPLVIFTFEQVVGWERVPLEVGREQIYPIQVQTPMNANVDFRPEFFSRGGRMRTYTFDVSLTWTSPQHPAIDGAYNSSYTLHFPVATCPLQDSDETLDDVQTAELSTPGGTAKEKRVAIRMNCGVDPPRARMTLSDAGDAGNTGSQLTPTADSDAEGVRVQLLRNGTEVQFGQTWDFEPGVGGVHDHAFTARYIRTSEALVPGLIKGEAVLNVDYW
ncbi:fimbrial protein [Stenotrophomonas geniculata]|uniref:fimbrial protein n=1 Tax=Stenotrophomonas geniculata TaxID=86188 RepID=UPI002E7915A6|nr:fimbrial protein [Stenotrophomonas geniculata]